MTDRLKAPTEAELRRTNRGRPIESLTVTLPIPPRGLSPNARTHWAKKAKLTKACKDEAALVTLQALMRGLHRVPRLQKAALQIEWFARTIAFPDPDNALANCKPIFDGMTHCGLFSDDKGLRHLPIIFAKDAKNPRVVITITPEGEG